MLFALNKSLRKRTPIHRDPLLCIRFLHRHRSATVKLPVVEYLEHL